MLGIGALFLLFVLLYSQRVASQSCETLGELLHHPTIDNDPAKELLQILKEDIKASREQEMRYFQMMCGLMNPTTDPNPLANGNPHHYHSSTLQPFCYGTFPKEDQHQLNGFQALNQSVRQNSVFLPYSASSRPRTPPLRNPLTVFPGSADHMIFFTGFQSTWWTLNRNVTPIYSTPARRKLS